VQVYKYKSQGYRRQYVHRIHGDSIHSFNLTCLFRSIVRQMRFARALKEQLQDNVKYIEALMGRFRLLAFCCFFCRGSLLPFKLSRSQGKKFWDLLLVTVKKFDGTDMDFVLSLHVLKLIHPPLCVALPHLSQGLVLVPALLHILLVDFVHRRLRLIISGVSKVFLQAAQLAL